MQKGFTPLEILRDKPFNQMKINKFLTGFTLLELLVVIAIIGVLSSIVLVSYNSYTGKARIAKTLQWASSVNHSLGDRAVGVWTFDNITGATINDDSGNNNNGTAYGGPAVVNGVMGNALQFDGVNDYVNVPHSSSLDISSQWTLSGWLKANSLSSMYMGIIRKGTYDDPHGWIMMTSEGAWTDNICFWGYFGGTWQGTACTPDLIPNTWYYITFTFENNIFKVYVNGQYINQSTQAGSLVTNSLDLQIGYKYRSSLGKNFDGFIDDVRIYSAALSQAQIQQHYAEGLKSHQNLASLSF